MAKLRDQIDTLLSQEMDRKNFLKYGGMILLSLIGVTGLLRVVLTRTNTTSLIETDKPHGYGSSRYGQ